MLDFVQKLNNIFKKNFRSLRGVIFRKLEFFSQKAGNPVHPDDVHAYSLRIGFPNIFVFYCLKKITNYNKNLHWFDYKIKYNKN